MAQKTLPALFLLCFLLQLHQPIFCDSSLQEIISDYQPKLQQLRYKIRTAVATTNIRLSIANAYVSDRISISITNIQQQLNALQQNVQQAQDSSTSDENLQLCIEQEQRAASNISFAAFSSCRRNEQIADIRRKIVDLKGLLAEVDQTVTACLVDSGIETEVLDICLQTNVVRIGRSLEEQEEVIGDGIDEVVIGTDVCSLKVEKRIEEGIVGIAEQFLWCLGPSKEKDSVERDLDNDSDSSED